MNKIKTQAILVFEILGRPAEYLKESLNKVLDTAAKEKGITVINRKIHEPKLVENKDKDGNTIKAEKEKQMFSSFAEIELNGEDLFDILRIVFIYMPSHIEIISPREFKLGKADMEILFNEIMMKLHNYDAIAKSAIMNNQILANRLNEMIEKQTIQKPNMPLEISYGKEEKNKKKSRKKK